MDIKKIGLKTAKGLVLIAGLAIGLAEKYLDKKDRDATIAEEVAKAIGKINESK